METEHRQKKVAVIGGGVSGLSVARMLSEKGKTVDYWFITPAHSDHLGALCRLMRSENFDINIKNICFNFPSNEWLLKKEDSESNIKFFEAVERQKLNVVTPHVGDHYECDGIEIEIINEPINYDNYPSINPTSIMFRVKFPKKTVLFLGDFDINGQNNFLNNFDPAKLKCEIVQMSHHGQKGVDRSFYELISPKICLYPTPTWLWENNFYGCYDPESAGKGPFTTLETRKWMEELGVVASYYQDADYLFT